MKFVPNHAPLLRGNEKRYLAQCVTTNWVSSVGPFVNKLEEHLARYVGAPYAVATGSGTSALHVALQLVGVEAGDEVLLPDLTFVASANAVHYCGAHPVFIDVEPDTWQLDPEKLEDFLEKETRMRGGRCIDKRTGLRVKAVMPVHLMGSACELDRIMVAARSRGLAVVEDAAEGIGVLYRGKHVGAFGDVSAFSFNGNKIITAGGGGMVVTSDKRIADRARYLTQQAKDDPIEFIHNEIGYNYRMSNLQAAVGCAQMERIEDLLARKRRIARWYEGELAGMPVSTMQVPQHVRPTWWLYTVLLAPGTTLERRKKIVGRLNDAGVGARGLWHPMHPLRPNKACRTWRIEHSLDLYNRAISLPSGAGLSASDVRRCARALREALASCDFKPAL